MTHIRSLSHEHGILDDRTPDERMLDRRRFLAKLGAGAIGATLLGLTDAAGLASAFARPVVSTTGAAGAARPVYMVALGDSVMWGQGLADAQKFQTKVASWIQSAHPDRRPVQRWNFAHSGATIGGLQGLDTRGAAHVTGQMTAAVLGRVGSPNSTRGRDFEDIPDFVPPRLRDSTDTTPRVTSGPPNHGRPREPREAELLGGEIPRTSPTLWRQLDIAVETLRTGRDPRDAKSAVLAPVDPAEVDLVLLDGGANDVDFLGTICNGARDSQMTYDYVRSIVEPRMRAFLPKALEAFPRATFVLTTVYQGISEMSTPAMLTPLVGLVAAIMGIPVAASIASREIPGLIARNAAMERAIADSYRAVASLAPDRIHVVSPDFGPRNGYGAPQSFLFHLEEIDPAEPLRLKECDALLGKWFDNTFVSGRVSLVDTPLWILCRDASTFHPNVAGANHYFMKIRDTLAKASPAFMRPLPKVRVVVNGTTAGATKTVTVTAFDEQSGQPVNGTVLVGGVKGQTGAPITYRPAGCAEPAAPDAAPKNAPVTRPIAGRAGRVGGAPVVDAASVACTGTVAVPGYADAKFVY